MTTMVTGNIGELLLSGWTMCAESCPNCNIPLMGKPNTYEMHCVQCKNIYVKEEYAEKVNTNQISQDQQSKKMNSKENVPSDSQKEVNSDKDIKFEVKRELVQENLQNIFKLCFKAIENNDIDSFGYLSNILKCSLKNLNNCEVSKDLILQTKKIYDDFFKIYVENITPSNAEIFSTMSHMIKGLFEKMQDL
eukprot:TRINITY_DN4788_c0_g1_i1.p1 TRINITY_DN4788_c0_g1~~TRINITY_DN4788_c0_g1_i1.p1  ORF type:complete len:205 (-),score=54.52 TRINITY_DN4788_c0_g1_i1:515-1090(-)